MYDSTFLIILPFILLGFWASSNVQSTFHKYSKVYPAGMICRGCADVIDRHGLDVRVERDRRRVSSL